MTRKHKSKNLILFDANSTRFCDICGITIYLGYGGEGNWRVHTEGKSHRHIADVKSSSRPIASFFETRPRNDEESRAGPSALPTAPVTPHIQCPGYQLVLPSGQHPFESYPLLMHVSNDLPWSVLVRKDGIYLISDTCTGSAHTKSTEEKVVACLECQLLQCNGYVEGLESRLLNGPPETMPWAYMTSGHMYETLEKKTKQISSFRSQLRVRKDAKSNVKERDCSECHLIVSPGELLQCVSPGCTTAYHLTCRGLSEKPAQAWFCDQEHQECTSDAEQPRKKRRGDDVTQPN